MATFTGYGTAQVELSDNRILEIETEFIACGEYTRFYQSPPTEYMYGWWEAEMDIDESTITLKNPEVFTPTEIDEVEPDVKIRRLIKLTSDIDWELEADDEPDGDRLYDEWKEDELLRELQEN